MDSTKSIQEYIKSGKYFEEAQKWYNNKYLYPLFQRSIVFVLLAVLVILITVTLINVYSLLPLNKRVQYIISVDEEFNGAAKVTNANEVLGKPLQSIIKILAESYLIQRESYDYNNLVSQFEYIKNKSTRIIFRKFYNYMSLENYQSPVLRYQNIAKRKITIYSTVFNNDEQLSIYFNSQAKNEGEETFENMDWKADITFESDRINLEASPGSNFKFFVTDYKITLLRNNNDK